MKRLAVNLFGELAKFHRRRGAWTFGETSRVVSRLLVLKPIHRSANVRTKKSSLIITLRNDAFDSLSCKFLSICESWPSTRDLLLPSINLPPFFFFLFWHRKERGSKGGRENCHAGRSTVIIVTALTNAGWAQAWTSLFFFFLFFFFTKKNQRVTRYDPPSPYLFFFFLSFDYSVGRVTLYHNLRRRRGDVRRQCGWRMMTSMRVRVTGWDDFSMSMEETRCVTRWGRRRRQRRRGWGRGRWRRMTTRRSNVIKSERNHRHRRPQCANGAFKAKGTTSSSWVVQITLGSHDRPREILFSFLFFLFLFSFFFLFLFLSSLDARPPHCTFTYNRTTL